MLKDNDAHRQYGSANLLEEDNTKQFLQRVHIARNANRCNSQTISVCPSVGLSHSGVLYRRMKMQFSASGRTIILHSEP